MNFLSRFTVLRSAVRELWIVFAAKLLTILAYAIMNSTLVLWLSSDLGYNDTNAGYLVALWSSVMTMCVVMVGSLTDAIGLRRTFLIGLWMAIGARILMTVTTNHFVALGLGLFPLAFGEAMLTPVMVAAIKRYATIQQRSISFSMFYAMMNVGFFISAFIIDAARKSMGEYGGIDILGVHFSTYRSLFLISTILSVPTLLLIYFWLRPGVEMTEDGVKFTPEKQLDKSKHLLHAIWSMAWEALQDTGRIFAGLWRQSAFYKFLLFLTLVVAVRLIFYHMHYTYPKFGIRELGEGAPIMRLWAINPLMIIFLVPIVGALTQRYAAYPMVVLGSSIAAASVFIMALPTAWFQVMADGWAGRAIGHWWLGLDGAVHPYYVMVFIFIFFLSIGEAIYSPRLYEYPAAIAPKGQEASYMALSFLPYFVAKFFVGMLSGLLLAKHCPAEGQRNSQMLWLIIALITMITPIGLIALGRFIRVKEAGREE